MGAADVVLMKAFAGERETEIPLVSDGSSLPIPFTTFESLSMKLRRRHIGQGASLTQEGARVFSRCFVIHEYLRYHLK